ncbi:hypothetical protein MPH47_06220 [Psychrobacillus psychrodurans]|uniref:hypothetical protein n=1 Tax=Psychrobacillus psychrodurans TaxID=126157 RepID=UPI001F4E531A|nr:hypothetical protein [Psychrobacillus psychrodurans]MCK1996826.1 hypothetical protein [Psychrobacillus psychrodurans]
MPNWCVGVLKVRGTKEEVKKFLLEGLSPLGGGLFGDEPVEAEIQEDEWELNIRAKHGFHIEGSRRNFIENNIDFYFDTDSDIKVCTISGYKAAWGLDTGALVDLSTKYQVDLKIYAFERGMEYNHDFEVRKGVIEKNFEIKFDDYEWECIDPTIGG